MKLTGKALQAARRRAGINQTKFGRSIGVSRHTISYWENKEFIKLAPVGPIGTVRKIYKALGLPYFYPSNARARIWGLIDHQQKNLVEGSNAARNRELLREAAQKKTVCNAKTRKGTPCRLKSEPGRLRCKFHGGKSTGPKTSEGLRKISEAQRKRWVKSKARTSERRS